MRDGYRIKIAKEVRSQIRVEVLGDKQELLVFTSTDWEATFRLHERLVFTDLRSSASVESFQVVVRSEHEIFSGVFTWSSSTKGPFVKEWARMLPEMAFVYSIADKAECWVGIRRVDLVLRIGQSETS